MKDIYDYFMTQLNDNENDLVYRGNFLFQFHTDSMSVFEPVTGKLVNEKIEYRPTGIIVSEQVPFVESNQRVDWLIQIGILVPIVGAVYDATTDLDYANIASVCTAMNGLNATINSKKYAFKVNKYPKYEGFQFLGKDKWAILTVTLNVTEMTTGSFGQDEVFKLDDVTLDVVDAEIVMSKRTYVSDEKATTTSDKNQEIGRVMQWTLTINYDSTNAACQALLLERKGTQTFNKIYTLKEGTSSYTVMVRSASERKVPNSVRRLVVVFVEAVT